MHRGHYGRTTALLMGKTRATGRERQKGDEEAGPMGAKKTGQGSWFWVGCIVGSLSLGLGRVGTECGAQSAMKASGERGKQARLVRKGVYGRECWRRQRRPRMTQCGT